MKRWLLAATAVLTLAGTARADGQPAPSVPDTSAPAFNPPTETTQPAPNPNQFDLECKGMEIVSGIVPDSLLGANTMQDVVRFDSRFSVDLEHGRLVEKPNNGKPPVFWPEARDIYVSPTQIEVSRPDATPEHHWTIVRSTGLIMAYDGGNPVSSTSGQCEKLPFTGLPANKF